uniref:E2f-associated phosphoprotein n=2 Tax=Neolamprologus brichardi TaxID=32507 RepID=A0A3Q4I4V9_NEOBR
MNKLGQAQDFESYEIEEPSDEERAASRCEDNTGTVSVNTVCALHLCICSLVETSKQPGGGGAEGGGSAVGGPGLSNPQMYDEVYFDSDSEEDGTPSSSTSQRRRQRTIPTNDELLYDPDEDDRDQAWVDARRREYSRRKRPAAAFHSKLRHPEALPHSDAVLNCPACMTTLCLDCQRHEKYRTQYRAMFVMNCTVKREEVLRYKNQPEKNRRNRKRRRGQQTETPADETPAAMGMEADEVYHPVQCSECSTEVAVFDKDEVYHFFNILASHC